VVRALPPATRRSRVRPFEGSTPVREVSFVRIREHLRREVADAIVDALVATIPSDLVVAGGEKRNAGRKRAPTRGQRVLAPLSV
jgi:hypothetical protein